MEKNISRREFLWWSTFATTGCVLSTSAGLLRIPNAEPTPPSSIEAPLGEWQEQLREWMVQRPRSSYLEERNAYPYLHCYNVFPVPIAPDLVIPEFSTADDLLIPDVSVMVDVCVGNEGNFPAWTCYLEIFEWQPGDLLHRVKTIITLQPGEMRVVRVKWLKSWQNDLRNIVAMCYDPLLDPLDFELSDSCCPNNRHLATLFFDQVVVNMVEEFCNDWSLTVSGVNANFNQRFVISGSESSDGIYPGAPEMVINRVSGLQWSLTMEWNDNSSTMWYPSRIQRSVTYTIQEGVVITLGADDGLAPGDGDFNDLVIVCRSLD